MTRCVNGAVLGPISNAALNITFARRIGRPGDIGAPSSQVGHQQQIVTFNAVS